MGYSHNFTQRRKFSKANFDRITADITAICALAMQEGIKLGDPLGEKPLESAAEIADTWDGCGKVLSFNGVGDEHCETFVIYKERRPIESCHASNRLRTDWVKTARRDYDTAVTACLVYMEAMHPAVFSVASDGNVENWKSGLELARRALPHLADTLDIPKSVQFDSQFTEWLRTGNRWWIRQRHDGAVCIGKDEQIHAVYAGLAAENFGDHFRTRESLIPQYGVAYSSVMRARDRLIKKFADNPELWGGERV